MRFTTVASCPCTGGGLGASITAAAAAAAAVLVIEVAKEEGMNHGAKKEKTAGQIGHSAKLPLYSKKQRDTPYGSQLTSILHNPCLQLGQKRHQEEAAAAAAAVIATAIAWSKSFRWHI